MRYGAVRWYSDGIDQPLQPKAKSQPLLKGEEMTEELAQIIHETLNDNLIITPVGKVISQERLREVSERVLSVLGRHLIT